MNPHKKTVAVILMVATETQAAPLVEPFSGTGFLLNSLVALGLVIALAVIGLKFLKRLGNFQTSRQGRLQIIDTLSLGNNERLLLVQVDDQELLIGMTPGRISTLMTLAETQHSRVGDSLPPATKLRPGPDSVSAKVFAKLLNKELAGQSNHKADAGGLETDKGGTP